MRYRPHIDGIRTLAVVPVVLYHVGVPGVTGGFVGVDVFFVISGYLITSVLLGDLHAQRFSIARFYQRRIQRLLPALAVVLIAVWFASALLFFPSELGSVGWQILTAATFSSNFYFWTQDGYFTASAETQPLLHTWSLAVEEQFYILFPILLYVVFRFARKRLGAVLIALSIVSFIGCVLLSYVSESTAFFMLPFRAWELGIGAILAVIGAREVSARWAAGLRFLGLALIVVPMLTYTSGVPVFPGWAAALPAIGTALLIGWGAQGVIGKALSWRPVVYVGGVSYSMYLWHWPLIVFWKVVNGPVLEAWEMICLVIASFALAALSTTFVERPFRTAKVRAARPRTVIAIGAAALVILGGMGFVQTRPSPVSLMAAPESVIATAAVANYIETPDHGQQFRRGSCFISGYSDEGEYDPVECATTEPNRPNILLLGDSHAAQYWGALSEIFPNANVMQATASGCRTLLGTEGTSRCTEARDWALDELIPSTDIDVVILGGRWRSDELGQVGPTIEYLKKYISTVVVIGPTVEYESALPTLAARSELYGHDFDFATLRVPDREEVDHEMRKAVESAGAIYLSVLDTECSGEDCMLFAPDGVPLQFDYGHLTMSGSRFVLQPYEDRLLALIADR